ncbi:Na+/H+ antiporter NhaA [Halomonas beimenensis]|uniref:Na+/H+ antiporter NhaA type n=1 Tax=Halomonas beimenensis TaxID=475662 RepID=A0A291P8X9_9GAMM|nr:Na+/H+ antiporter NhaA [Halomonas beimenensis]ATJ83344.1 Na+/H+ antiporter NhaA type [Halomonas beimenensis]
MVTGISFTMSLFIAGLAFDAATALLPARQGVLAMAALVEATVLAVTLPRSAVLRSTSESQP